MRRRHAILGTVLSTLTGLLPCATMAQDQEPLTIVVGFAAGGPLDSAARILAKQLGQGGRAVVVENRAGAAGLLAAQYVARGPKTGNVLLLAPNNVVAVHPYIFDNLGFDPVKDLQPVAELGAFHYGLGVPLQVPATNVREFISWVKERPGKVSYASLGKGSFAQLVGIAFNNAIGADMTEVPYKGSAPAVMALQGGVVQASFDSNSGLAPHVRANTIKLLATTGTERSPLTPNVPTFKELKLNLGPVEDAQFWYGFFAPTGTPKQTVDRLNEAINAAVKEPSTFKQLQLMDLTPRTPSAADLAKTAMTDNAMWGKVIKEAGLAAAASK